jgi:hydroxypyruvate isomerase
LNDERELGDTISLPRLWSSREIAKAFAATFAPAAMRGLAANLSFFFKDRPFIERFAASRAAGFRAVEFMFAGDGKYACDSADVRRALEENELEQALLNAPAGDWLNGERGIGGIAARETDWKASFEYGLRFAQDVRCSKMHIMAGLRSHGATEDVYVERLRWASRIAADVGVCICVEPLNPTDFPGYLVPDVSSALRILERVDAPGHCQLQLDLYHVAMVEGTDLTSVIRRALPHTAHVQIANPPGRNEPGVGVIDFPPLLAQLGELGYSGWVGCEYKPSTPITEHSLEWARAAGWLTPATA